MGWCADHDCPESICSEYDHNFIALRRQGVSKNNVEYSNQLDDSCMGFGNGESMFPTPSETKRPSRLNQIAIMFGVAWAIIALTVFLIFI